MSLDAYNKEFVFVVVHGIREPQRDRKLEDTTGTATTVLLCNNDNFVTLASQYREYHEKQNVDKHILK